MLTEKPGEHPDGISESTPALVEYLEQLIRKAQLNKDRHFAAGQRTRNYHIWLALPVVVINLFISSVLFTDFIGDPEQKFIAAALSLTAALTGGILGFFNFGKRHEGHRSIGNRYLRIIDAAELACAGFWSQVLMAGDLAAEASELGEAYGDINEEAEPFPTSNRDYGKAQKKARQRWLEGRGPRPPHKK